VSAANCAKMLVVPNMKVLTIWGILSSSSALGHYLTIFTDFEGDKSIHG
jgi:glycerol-3-phosphate acyltransferase PlsY